MQGRKSPSRLSKYIKIYYAVDKTINMSLSKIGNRFFRDQFVISVAFSRGG